MLLFGRPRSPWFASFALCALVVTGCAQTPPTQRPTRPEEVPAMEPPPTEPMGPIEDTIDEADPRYNTPAIEPVTDWLQAQIELARRGFSSGSIDGVRGAQTAAALKAFQRNQGIPETGELDLPTKAALPLSSPSFTTHTFTEDEFYSLQEISTTWLEKSQQATMGYANALELIAELYHASPNLIRRLNPQIDWTVAVRPGTQVQVPDVKPFKTPRRPALIHVKLSARILQATDDQGKIIVHFPVSIARNVDKRPVGELQVIVVAPDPNYTFDPVNFPESEEGQQLGRRLIIPPGPNNPVGLAWIGLSRPGYGIHGTPDPEKVGRTESHGCFRLANWDAIALLGMVKAGTRVVVEP